MKSRVLFRVAAGPRLGFGHLIRSGTIAAAMGVAPVISLRGSRRAEAAAARLGYRVAGPLEAALDTVRPALLVVDDPSRAAARQTIRVARRHGVPTASVHDLGVARCPSDLSIDGSIAPGPMDLAGVRFAVLHPRLKELAAARRVTPHPRPTIVVAFGGGSRRRLAAQVAAALARLRPGIRVFVANGFVAGASHNRSAGASERQLVGPQAFQTALAGATAAVLAGGVTLYEACALGVPAVAIAITAAQRRSIAGLARRGAVVDGGCLGTSSAATAARAAQLIDELLESPGRQRELARMGRRLVDGRGAERVAEALQRVADRRGRRAA